MCACVQATQRHSPPPLLAPCRRLRQVFVQVGSGEKKKCLTREEVLKAESCLRVHSLVTRVPGGLEVSDGIDATCHVGGTAGLGGTFLPQVLICSTGPCRCSCCWSVVIEESPASSHLPSVLPRLTPRFPGQTITFGRSRAAAPCSRPLLT